MNDFKIFSSIYNIEQQPTKMSQSDYIKYKRVGNQLRVDNTRAKQSAVFDNQRLIDYKQYALENAIVNTVPSLNRLAPAGSHCVFNMDKYVGACPTFPVCSRTDLRTNRRPMSNVYFTPTPQPNNIKIVNNSANIRSECDCHLSNQNVCRCKLGAFGLVR